jgi:hypothetical protein
MRSSVPGFRLTVDNLSPSIRMLFGSAAGL